MASDDGERSAFARPGFVIAAALVAAIVVAGIIVAIVGPGGGSSHQAQPAPSTRPAATGGPSADPSAASSTSARPSGPPPSVCGLPGTILSGTLTAAPKTAWHYQGVTAYPTSATAGPGKTAPSGYRYCFQHSPTGAAFAAANAITNAFAQGSASKAAVAAWIDYFVSDGPYRSQIIAAQTDPSSSPPAGEQVTIEGVRLLDYTGGGATVAVAASLAGGGNSGLASFTYSLTWQGGDWKIDASTSQPFSAGPLQTLTNYLPWKAGS